MSLFYFVCPVLIVQSFSSEDDASNSSQSFTGSGIALESILFDLFCLCRKAFFRSEAMFWPDIHSTLEMATVLGCFPQLILKKLLVRQSRI